MKPIALGVVVLDKFGTIVGFDGPAGRFSVDNGSVGRSWHDVFGDWGIPPIAFDNLAALPCQFNATMPSGEPVSIELTQLPATADASRFVAILRGEDALGLTPQQAQLCGLGELSATVAHEINNALTLLCGWLDLLLSELPKDDPHRSTLELLASESERIGKITRNLLQVARGGTESPHELDMRTIIQDVVNLVGYEMKNSNIEVESCVSPDMLTVHGSAGRLKQALLNLLMNARQAMPKGGRVKINAQRDLRGDVVVAVEDTGVGVPPEDQRRIFSPFFTTKRDGTGLGLPVTRRIVEDHGGTLRLENQPGSGARFTLNLPAGQSASP